MIIRNIKLYFCVFFIISCSSIKQDKSNIVGEYEFKDEYVLGLLILKENNLFEYKYSTDLMAVESKGQWELKKNSIFLKSEKQYETDYLIVKESYSSLPYLELTDEIGTLPAKFEVKINGNSYFTNEKGRIDLKHNDSVKVIEVFYAGLSQNKSVYEVKDKKANVFNIKIIPKNTEKKYFNESLKIGNNYVKIHGFKYLKK